MPVRRMALLTGIEGLVGIRPAMSRRPARSAAQIALAALLALQVVAVGAAPAGAAEAAFRLDLASKGDYVAQANFVQCVGASMQMMLNMINEKDDRTAKTQLQLQISPAT